LCFRKFLELKDPISGNQDALKSHIRANWSTLRCDILPDCTMLAICWVIAESTVVRLLNSPERSLTNSVCAGEESGKEGGLGVVLELAAAFVDSLMMKLSGDVTQSSRVTFSCLATVTVTPAHPTSILLFFSFFDSQSVTVEKETTLQVDAGLLTVTPYR
jgi:hypothetical protein